MFSDVTAYRQAERVLQDANLDLESIVQERTKKLEQVNEDLASARYKAEEAHIKKSQYLKACSHDLMQPLEAARLFTSALADQKNLNPLQESQVNNIDRSLKVASDLLSDLSEIARIESGNIKPQLEVFKVNELFDNLAQEFSASAVEAEVDFRVVRSSAWIKSDKRLLRRILQNLIGNAFRYACSGKVLLGARVVGSSVNIQVLDNGPGIPKDKQQLVFEQFTQLNTSSRQSTQGLGLGLNITKSLAQLLDHTLQLKSKEDQGCKFSLLVEKAAAGNVRKVKVPIINTGFKDVTVLCIDNDPDVLAGMVALLEAWQCNVLTADSYASAQQVFAEEGERIRILLVDYQLNNNEDGLTLIAQLRESCPYYLPAILITAATENQVDIKAEQADVGFMRKVVKPAALRAMMSAKLAKNLQDNYLS
jgi:signal transduction histidine kinase/CheY-like chemotaxis protein